MTTSSDPVVVDSPAPYISRITINQAKFKNPVNTETRSGLTKAIGNALADDAIRALIITGAEGTFCAGGDIRTLGTLDEVAGRARMRLSHDLVRLILGAEKPIVS
ncbi:MAG: enoyl-CoA hydratase/isomerase family protein, partial [Kordiimonadaceae bacterium]|nr:enoyl-CoA hydratase/isomerase family protein [Kordiimonadaceae bacterium]